MDSRKEKQNRGGLGAFLATARILFDNPLIRMFLKIAAVNTVMCKHICDEGEQNIDSSAIYHALSVFAGIRVECPISTRFLIDFLNTILRIGIHVMHGDDREVAKALKDPALRRGVALVLKGLGLYGVTVPQKLPAPFLIVWNFTNMCNLRCMHCYQRADAPLSDELSLYEKLRVVHELDKVGVAAIALSGGEPSIHPDFLTIIKAIAARGMYAAVATNGWRFADIDFMKKAVEAGLRYVEVSVDSANPKKHDAFRGVEGSWARAIKALENAVKLGVNHAMAVTITKMNINEIDDILDLAQSIGVKRVVFFNFVPTGRGVEIKNLDLDPVEREKFMRKIYVEMKRRGIEIVTTAPQYGRIVLQASMGREIAPTHFAVQRDPIAKAVAEFVGGCGAGRIYAAIQPNGIVTPCVFMPISVGSLRTSSFAKIWSENELLLKLRDKSNLKGHCRVCNFRNVCGGCRARAYAYFNDPLAPDPGCIYNVDEWRKIQKEALKGYEMVVESSK